MRTLLSFAAVLLLCTGCLNEQEKVNAELGSLTVASEHQEGYQRKDWGDWTVEKGCSTRQQVLLEQGTDTHKSRDCNPVGIWSSPYDKNYVSRWATDFQIDHVVPLKEAWESGAYKWNRSRLNEYYNDKEGLLAVTIHANESKGDRDAAEWLPDNVDYHCQYAKKIIDIKTKWELSIDPVEKSALAKITNRC